jgi:hypothetical protein
MLQVLETLHLKCMYLYFYHIALQILNCIYKKFKNGKIPYSFLPSFFINEVSRVLLTREVGIVKPRASGPRIARRPRAYHYNTRGAFNV